MKRCPVTTSAAAGRRAQPGSIAVLDWSPLILGLTVLGLVALCACGGTSSTASSSPSVATGGSVSLPPTASSSATATPMSVTRTESVVKALMTAWNNAWSANRDRRSLSSLYADDVQYYDAAAIGTVITKSDIDAMGRDPDWWKAFRLTLKSSFVSWDGRFAATLSRIALRDESGNLPWQPAVSVLAVANDKIVWECDYYGGEPGMAGQTTPMFAIPPDAVAPGSPAAKTAIAEATATIGQWLAAYNGRDAEAFLSFYAEEARYVDVVSPRWRIMTKSQLAADVVSRFPRTDFQSRLEPSPGSAMDSSFFVSADGRFAAVQGTFNDQGAPGGLPMLVILELKAGEIVQQCNFIAMDRSLLRP